MILRVCTLGFFCFFLLGCGGGSVTEKLKECAAPPPAPPCACADLESEPCAAAYARFDGQLSAAQASCVNEGECGDLTGCLIDDGEVSQERRDCLFDCGLDLAQCADDDACGVAEVTGCLDENDACRGACPSS
jgi:hypothetical protein